MSPSLETIIYKLTLNTGYGDIGDLQQHKMPANARILSAQFQDGKLSLWFAFTRENENKLTVRNFIVAFTGIPLAGKLNWFSHISTLQLGGYVYHVFEVIP